LEKLPCFVGDTRLKKGVLGASQRFDERPSFIVLFGYAPEVMRSISTKKERQSISGEGTLENVTKNL
jgi:hypothetical protein